MFIWIQIGFLYMQFCNIASFTVISNQLLPTGHKCFTSELWKIDEQETIQF